MTTRLDNSPTAILRREAIAEDCDEELILTDTDGTYIMLFLCGLLEGHGLPHQSFDDEQGQPYCMVWPTEDG